jgi:hypothetical protein
MNIPFVLSLPKYEGETRKRIPSERPFDKPVLRLPKCSGRRAFLGGAIHCALRHEDIAEAGVTNHDPTRNARQQT